MKNAIILFAFLLPITAFAEVTPRVCEVTDINTPFINRPIMVGTKLPIIVSSDIGGTSAYDNACDLASEGDNINYGVITPRGDEHQNQDPCFFSYTESVYPAAGTNAVVRTWFENGIFSVIGASMYSTDPAHPPSPQAGDWFIVDYTALAVGQCDISFYREFQLAFYLSFENVPTRDFNQNTVVDFPDFAILANYWGKTCNGDCQGADLDSNYVIDLSDLMLFCDYWLEKTMAEPINQASLRDFNRNKIVDFPDYAVFALYWQVTCSYNCGGTDLDGSKTVNLNDLIMFCDYWLERTEPIEDVPTRDLNQNKIVDFPDYAILASYWQQNCLGNCEGADLDASKTINLTDLMLFCDYWLETTE